MKSDTLPIPRTNAEKNLPERWGWTTLDTACLIIQGQSPESTTYNNEGKGMPFFQGKAEFGELYPSPVKWCTSPKKKALKGDILISVRAPVGPTNIAPFECCVGRGLAALRSRDGINSKYILYNLRSQINEIANMGTGSTFTAINGAQLKGIEIPLAPLDQQKLIVSEIEKQFSRLDEAVAALKRVRASLKRYKASVLKAAVEGRLTEEWRKENPNIEPAEKLLKRILTERKKKWEETNPKKKYKEPSTPDTSNLPDLPEGWVWATVEQLCFISSGQTPKGIDNVSEKGNIPWFRVGDMNTSGNEKIMQYAEIYLTKEMVNKLRLHIQPEGTIIFPKRGGAIATNKKRILSKPSTYDLNTMGLLPIVTQFEYFWNWFLSIDLGRLGDGSNVPQINNKDIEPLIVPLPPFAEQEKIVSELERRLSVINEGDKAIDINLKRAERLRQAILKKAFLGKLI